MVSDSGRKKTARVNNPKTVSRLTLKNTYALFLLLMLQSVLSAQSADSSFYRQVPDSVVSRLKKQPVFAYANDAAYWTKEKETAPSPVSNFFLYLATHSWVKWTLLTAFTALLCFLLFKVIQTNSIRLFYSVGKSESSTNILPGTSENLDDLISSATAAGDFRLAIRGHFLQTLQKLDKKNLIQLHPQGTNQEYLSSMRNQAGFKTFRQLTYYYEYIWYGEFSIDADLYQRIAQVFKVFNR
jgi:Domain of unknown function (DUF4129)